MNFNAREARSRIVLWIRDWFNVNGEDSTAIIGISGGKDSTIAAALLIEALGEGRVMGITMPATCNVEEVVGAQKVAQWLNMDLAEVNIGPIINAYMMVDPTTSRQAELNLPPKIRMAELYRRAADWNGRVCNTSNHSERMAGYFTRFGDECGDFSLFHDLSASEVVAIGMTYVEDGILPESLVIVPPADGLTGKTDEDNLGFTYDEIEEYVESLEEEGGDILCDDRVNEKAYKMRRAYFGNAFKRNTVHLPHPAYGDLIS